MCNFVYNFQMSTVHLGLSCLLSLYAVDLCAVQCGLSLNHFDHLYRPYQLHSPAYGWPIATDVAHSAVCVSVCLNVGHTGELHKNG